MFVGLALFVFNYFMYYGVSGISYFIYAARGQKWFRFRHFFFIVLIVKFYQQIYGTLTVTSCNKMTRNNIYGIGDAIANINDVIRLLITWNRLRLKKWRHPGKKWHQTRKMRFSGYIDQGWVKKKFPILLGINYSTVLKFLKRFQQPNSVENVPRSGRPKKMDDRGSRVLNRILKEDRSATLVDITNKFNTNSHVQ